jgi:hypothetical protein
MQRLNSLWQAMDAVSAVTELARQSQTYHFNVAANTTFYLRAEQAEVKIIRWPQLKIEVLTMLQAPFGWRLATDQDDAGVYVVARRRMVVGSIASAAFSVLVPTDTYLILKLTDCRLVLDGVDGTLHIPPMNAAREIAIAPPDPEPKQLKAKAGKAGKA